MVIFRSGASLALFASNACIKSPLVGPIRTRIYLAVPIERKSEIRMLRNVALAIFPRMAEHWPARPEMLQAFSLGCTGSESIVYTASCHDAWIQAVNTARRAWREGQALPMGDAAFVARIRTATRRFPAVSSALAWVDGAPARHRRSTSRSRRPVLDP